MTRRRRGVIVGRPYRFRSEATIAPPSSPAPLTTTEVNDRVHARITEEYLTFLEALTALELEKAETTYERFQELLLAHLHYEDEAMVPLVERLHAAHGDPLIQLPAHLDGDHRVLERNLGYVEAALARLRAVSDRLRRALVEELNTFLLLGRVLEHHDQREHRFAYPLIDEHATSEEQRALREGLSRLLDEI